MSIVQAGLEKAYERQKNALIEEASQAGARVLKVEEVRDEGSSKKAAVGDTLKTLFGGTLNVNALQIIWLETGGKRHLYVQPYSSMYPLPGEHHAVLAGALPEPIVLVPGGWNPKWEVPANQELAKTLNSASPELKAVSKKCEFAWTMGMGKIDLPWAVQVSSLGDSRSHLVMKAGRYGGVTTYEVGFKQFLALQQRLANLMKPDPIPRQQPVHPAAFSLLFLEKLAEPVAPASVPGKVQAVASPEVERPAPVAPRAQAPRSQSRFRWYHWVLFLVAVGGITGGIQGFSGSGNGVSAEPPDLATSIGVLVVGVGSLAGALFSLLRRRSRD